MALRTGAGLLASQNAIRCQGMTMAMAREGCRQAAGSGGSGAAGGGAMTPSQLRQVLAGAPPLAADRECPKGGTTREGPESAWGGLPGAEEPRAELSSSIQQLQQEPKASQPQVLASIQALQLALDTCKRTSSEQLSHLQQRERVVEQEQHHRLFLLQQLQALVGKVCPQLTTPPKLAGSPEPAPPQQGHRATHGGPTPPRWVPTGLRCTSPQKQKDEEVQTEVTYMATQSPSCSSCSSLEERDRPEMLEQIRAGLGTQEQQSQGQGHNLAWLQKELRASWAREQRSLHQLCRAQEAIQELQQQVASNGKHLAELRRQAQDMATLQAELAQARQEKARQEELVAAYQKEQQHLLWELRKLWGYQKQSMAAQALQERLQELSSQAQHWQEEHHNIQQALSEKEEELVVCKVELAFLQEKLSEAREQLNSQAQQCQQRHQNIQKALAEKEEELVVCKVELAFLQEKLSKAREQLTSQARHCQKEHHNIQKALAEKEEELVVCKVELAFLQEELSKAREQLRDRKRQCHGARGWALSSEE